VEHGASDNPSIRDPRWHLAAWLIQSIHHVADNPFMDARAPRAHLNGAMELAR
jgi:hypothetical protein